jgi:hypothetical protein
MPLVLLEAFAFDLIKGKQSYFVLYGPSQVRKAAFSQFGHKPIPIIFHNCTELLKALKAKNNRGKKRISRTVQIHLGAIIQEFKRGNHG